MNAFVLILAVVLPTPYDLVDQLGSNDYAARRDAMRQLIKLEDEAVPALLVGLKSKDYEISYDCDKILNVYYDVEPSNGMRIPPIWSLNTLDRFNSAGSADLDIAKRYYLLAFGRGDILDSYEWREDYVEQRATRYYLYDRMVAGMKRHEAITYLDQMVRNRGRLYYKKDQGSNYPGCPKLESDTRPDNGLIRIDDGWFSYMFGP